MNIQLQELMGTSPEKLAQLQHDKLQKHVLDIIDSVRDRVAKGDYSELTGTSNILEYSPSGDAYGKDNHFVDFGYVDGYDLDIAEVCEKLEALQTIAKGENK